MTEIAVILIIAAVVVLVIAFLLGRLGRATGEMGAREGTEGEPVRPRPPVADFHVRGEEAQVYFEVPLGADEVDEVLRELLLHEAVEVVREKRHALPIGEVTRVVAFGRRQGEFARVGHVALKEPGLLPPPAAPVDWGRLAAAETDPLEGLEADFRPPAAPGEVRREEELGPIGAELRLPGAVEAALRARGADPASMSAGEVVQALLELVGYRLTPAGKENSYLADRKGTRTFLRVVPHQPGEYPELDERAIEQFVIDFVSSGAQRGLLVTDKYGAFEIYNRERRDRRLRFITRERLQHFVDALAVG